MAKSLYQKIQEKNIEPKHVAEVGVYYPHFSNIYGFIKDGVRTTLVEPDPESIRQIRSHFADNKNVTLFEVAIFDHDGTVELVKKEASTYVKGLESSPCLANSVNNSKTDELVAVKAVTFNHIDDGSIELLSIDIEGGEWYVVKHMVSRPSVISIETHGGAYVNPFIKEITEWMNTNDYSIWFKNKTDTVYIKNGSIKVSKAEKIVLILQNCYNFVNRIRKSIKMYYLKK
ncbi:MAG TPA: FkbM family methyltransferase [Chitinispirillaceae bacterium]|nr:FkbM family methyltransferase [Chitinispirillaceae bacterium]